MASYLMSAIFFLIKTLRLWSYQQMILNSTRIDVDSLSVDWHIPCFLSWCGQPRSCYNGKHYGSLCFRLSKSKFDKSKFNESKCNIMKFKKMNLCLKMKYKSKFKKRNVGTHWSLEHWNTKIVKNFVSTCVMTFSFGFHLFGKQLHHLVLLTSPSILSHLLSYFILTCFAGNRSHY